MRCERAQALMDRYVRHELADEQREPLEAHFRGCQTCQQERVRFERLVEALTSAPAPPVPEGFVGRVMARSRQESQVPRPLAGIRLVLSRWWEHGEIGQVTRAAAAIAAGLLLGLTLGQQTWRHAAYASGPTPSTAGRDTEIVYSLDYLSGAPRGSFTKTYLSLTSVGNEQEF